MPCFSTPIELCSYQVILLDDQEYTVELKTNLKAGILLTQICDHLTLLEHEYFGIRYLGASNEFTWLDLNKSLGSQITTESQSTVYFGVKFYVPDPCKLDDEVTRYQFFLQAKKDVQIGRLPVSFEDAAELGALAVQSEYGDFDSQRHQTGYTSNTKFVPNQTADLENQIASIHQSLVGKLPAVVEYMYLEKVKWIDLYGVDLHPVLGEGLQEYFCGLSPTGVVVYKGKNRVGNYFWPRITKINYKGRYFCIKVRDKNNDENTYTFELATKTGCRHLWKCAVEHHDFFRRVQAVDMGRGTLRNRTHELTDDFRRPPSRVYRQSARAYKADVSPQKENVTSPPVEQHKLIPQSSPTTPIPQRQVMTPILVQHSHTDTEDMGRDVTERSPLKPATPWENHNDSGGLYTSGRDSPQSVHSERLKFPRRAPSASDVSDSGQRDYRGRRNYRTDGDSGGETEATRRRRRRRRARSHSPGKKPPEELLKHIEFELVEPSNEADLQEIKFTTVETANSDVWIDPSKAFPRSRRHRENARKFRSDTEMVPNSIFNSDYYAKTRRDQRRTVDATVSSSSYVNDLSRYPERSAFQRYSHQQQGRDS